MRVKMLLLFIGCMIGVNQKLDLLQAKLTLKILRNSWFWLSTSCLFQHINNSHKGSTHVYQHLLYIPLIIFKLHTRKCYFMLTLGRLLNALQDQYIVVYKCLHFLYRLSCVLIFDFVVLVLAILLSLATSMTVSIGLRVTCSAAKDSIKSHYPE